MPICRAGGQGVELGEQPGFHDRVQLFLTGFLGVSHGREGIFRVKKGLIVRRQELGGQRRGISDCRHGVVVRMLPFSRMRSRTARR